MSSYEKIRDLPCALISVHSMSSYTRDSKNRCLSTAVHRRHMWGCFPLHLCHSWIITVLLFPQWSNSVCTWCHLNFYFPFHNSAEYDYFKYHPMEEVGHISLLCPRWYENTWRLEWGVDSAVYCRSGTGWRRFNRTTLTLWRSWIMEWPMKWKPSPYLR